MTLISGHFDSSLRFWSAEKGDSIKELPNAHKGQITSLALTSNGQQVLSCGRDDTLRLFDLRAFDCVRTMRAPDFRVGLNWAKASLSADGRFAAAPGHAGDVFIWDVQNGTLHSTLSGAHDGVVSAVAFNPIQRQLASGDRAGKLTLWE